MFLFHNGRFILIKFSDFSGKGEQVEFLENVKLPKIFQHTSWVSILAAYPLKVNLHLTLSMVFGVVFFIAVVQNILIAFYYY